MAYIQGSKARLDRIVGGTAATIHGSGRLSLGSHAVTLTDIEWKQSPGYIALTFTDDAGDTHRENWWPTNKGSDAYSSKWRHWLAIALPDLAAILLYKQYRNISCMIGMQFTIDVDRTPGYYLKRDGSSWCALDSSDDSSLTDWMDLTAVHTAMAEAGIVRSYNIIESIDTRCTVENVKHYTAAITRRYR